MVTALRRDLDAAAPPRRHTLLVADTDGERRASAGAWVERELATGAKVYVKGWLTDEAAPEHHWLLGPGGARGARDAFAAGQMEILDFRTVMERCGGSAEGLAALQAGEVERALDEGWPSVAMTQESPHRPMAGEADVAELVAQESGYTPLMDRSPLEVLCQLTVAEENDTAIWETVAFHHRDVVDGVWSTAATEAGDGVWRLRGDLDAHVARRFGAAVHGALVEAARRPEGHADLHVDLSGVEFMDVACAEMLMLAARSAPGQRLVVHEPSRLTRRLLDALGRPPAVEVRGETA